MNNGVEIPGDISKLIPYKVNDVTGHPRILCSHDTGRTGTIGLFLTSSIDALIVLTDLTK